MENVKFVGWGVFRIEGRDGLWAWNDYLDDEEHDGYGVMCHGDEMLEIVKNVRDEKDVIIGMELVPFLCA